MFDGSKYVDSIKAKNMLNITTSVLRKLKIRSHVNKSGLRMYSQEDILFIYNKKC